MALRGAGEEGRGREKGREDKRGRVGVGIWGSLCLGCDMQARHKNGVC